jgi:hypothetical protein
LTDLLPNLGGEEAWDGVGPGWRGLADEPAVRAQRRLWRLLFAADARLLGLGGLGGLGDLGNLGELGGLGGGDAEAAPPWPEALGEPADAPVFPWLEADGRPFAWIATAEAAADAALEGRALAGAPPEVVRRVHDKAFAVRVAEEERLVPPVLRGCVAVLEPETLAAPDAADAVEAIVAAWPEWARARFTLKPRLGCAGRGRLAGEAGRLDRARTGAGLARLAERGGAILEPWLAREADLATQLHVDAGGAVTLLGSLEQVVSPAGVFLGHRGEIDTKGRIYAGLSGEETAREAAALVAAAAAREGYAGPCGVDAFHFVDPVSGGSGPSGASGASGGSGASGESTSTSTATSILRPVVELNARFTAGTVTLGLARRMLRTLKRELRLRASERMRFRFWLALDADERDEIEARTREVAGDALMVPLDEGPAPPALLFTHGELQD